MKIAVLGAGPAGLMTAHAAMQYGDVHIFSEKKKSTIGGAQYLHKPLPGITGDEPDGHVVYAKVGTAQGYASKVYGRPDAPTSWDLFEGTAPAWRLRDVYSHLVLKYWGLVQDAYIQPDDVHDLCHAYDMVFSTIPAKLLCQQGHAFAGQRVALFPRADVQVENLIVYSGRDSEAWYRTSQIFGHAWTEYRYGMEPSSVRRHQLTVNGVKPLHTDCTCHAHHPNYVRLGRFGQWRKAVLTHDAYAGAVAALGRVAAHREG